MASSDSIFGGGELHADPFRDVGSQRVGEADVDDPGSPQHELPHREVMGPCNVGVQV